MTERITHDLVQGSDAWIEFRMSHHGASEAAAMLGISPKVKRNELLHMKHTGTPKEFSDWVQEHILDHGHAVEALARPYIEASLCEDLYPVTMSIGDISASCDGLTMDERTAWEHKQWNAALAESLEHGELPEEFMPQAQQVLMVTGAERLIFTCSDGTDENMVSLEIKPNRAWFDNITDGWSQFRKDLAEYVPIAIPENPKAEIIMALPALAVQIRGEVITSNLPAFQAAAEKFIAGIKMDLETDEDFVNGDATVKFCDAKEKEIAIAMDAAIAQMASVDELMRTGNLVKDQLRTKRLALTKQIDVRKAQIKETAVAERRNKYAEHVAAINAELKTVQIMVPAPDFVGAIKGLKTIASLYDKLDTALANGKIAADAAAKDLRAKLDWYKAHEEHAFLFRDLQTLIQKPKEDFELAVTARIAEHKRAEDEKEAKRKTDEAIAQAAQPVIEAAAPRPADPSPIAAARPVSRVIPTSAPTLRLGQINERLAPIALTAEGLATLGFKHVATDKAAKLYHESDFEAICAALMNHIQAALHKQAA
ncbi:YqaJ viral recombinase family protein [Burkholderia ambifaria]|uniref:YqaJ viral recombinase family protein n=1 Tax=Burkholderia ambifaria TaxID=152480 RepID=UPI001BA0E057|nr:YqaJ viral recombinase family protein [Burkholderia ambifaria]MBR8182153.1 YqaJ viral recombinase family protein [Burkholderia ambifaria]